MNTLTLAVAGDAGSFSEQAGLLYAQQHNINVELLHATDMEGVLSAVRDGKAARGILPVVNSRGGLVMQAFSAMGKYLFTFVDYLPLEVHQCLLVRTGVTRETVTQIASHPQALKQCEEYLKKNFPGVPQIDWRDTATAAHDLSTGALPPTTAVLAPVGCAKIYNLEVLAENIEDMKPNITTFIIVKSAE